MYSNILNWDSPLYKLACPSRYVDSLSIKQRRNLSICLYILLWMDSLVCIGDCHNSEHCQMAFSFFLNFPLHIKRYEVAEKTKVNWV